MSEWERPDRERYETSGPRTFFRLRGGGGAGAGAVNLSGGKSTSRTGVSSTSESVGNFPESLPWNPKEVPADF